MDNEYEIKMDGEKKSWGNGAIRYAKNKGRFDLIPECVLLDILNQFLKKSESMEESVDPTTLLYYAYLYSVEDVTDENNHIIFWDEAYQSLIWVITLITIYHYGACKKSMKWNFDIENDIKYVCKMLSDLAIHFQKGAEKYGERNCQNGIPLWSFIDSGRRHLNQYLMGETDEPHHISAIWNFWMAAWTLKNCCDDDDVEECDHDKVKAFQVNDHQTFTDITDFNHAIQVNDFDEYDYNFYNKLAEEWLKNNY